MFGVAKMKWGFKSDFRSLNFQIKSRIGERRGSKLSIFPQFTTMHDVLRMGGKKIIDDFHNSELFSIAKLRESPNSN